VRVGFLVRSILLMVNFNPKLMYYNPIYTFNVHIITRHVCASILSVYVYTYCLVYCLIILDYRNIITKYCKIIIYCNTCFYIIYIQYVGS
jgi:hypothetical protein